jgi:hypothetical protein
MNSPKFFFELNIGDIFVSGRGSLSGSKWVKYSSRTVRLYDENGVRPGAFYFKDDEHIEWTGENIYSFKHIIREAARKHELKSCAPSI